MKKTISLLFLFLFIFSIILLMQINFKVSKKETAFWWWGTRIKPKRFRELTELNVERIFIKAGRILRDRDSYPNLSFKPILIPQGFQNKNRKTEFHIVLTAYYENWESVSIPMLIDLIKTSIPGFLRKLKQHGIIVSGIQLDLEGNIRGPDYIKVIAAIKKRFKKYQYSISIYPSFLKIKDIDLLLNHFDFIVMMFYDYSYDYHNFKMTDVDWINREIKRLKKYKKPYLIGLPIYGLITVYDQKKRNVYRQVDLPPRSINDNPVLTLVNKSNPFLYRVNKSFSYKYLTFQEGWFLRVYHADSRDILSIISQIKMDKKLTLGIAFFSYPMLDKWSLKYQEIKKLVSGVRKN